MFCYQAVLKRQFEISGFYLWILATFDFKKIIGHGTLNARKEKPVFQGLAKLASI